MPLPAPQTTGPFPAPSSPAGGLPVPTVFQDPYFGLYPSEQRSGLVAPASSTAVGAYGIQVASATTTALMQQQGVPAGISPTTKADEAIAKIASVNPDLAKKLAEQFTGQTDTHKSFWDDLKGVVGDVMAPVLNIGAKALDLLSRPAHIVPALLANKEGNVFSDLGAALTGEDKTTWSTVLGNWGIHSNILKGALGFGLDIATDPMTYMTFGTAGMGRALVAKAAAEAVGSHVAEAGFTEALGNGFLQHLTGVDLSTYSVDMMKDLFKSVRPGEAAASGVLNNMTAEAAAGMTSFGIRAGEENIARNALEASDFVHRMVTTVGVRNMPKEIELASGQKLTRDEVMHVLQSAESAQRFTEQGRLIAGALPGVRFRFGIPFTDFRYISPAIPYTSRANFGILRNFVTGTSGMTRLMNAIDSGLPGLSMDDFSTWVSSGYRAAAEANPALRTLGVRGTSFGSSFFSASDMLGGITSHFLPHAAVTRGGGLLAMAAADFHKVAKDWESQMLDQGWTHVDPETGQVTHRAQLYQQAGKALKHDDASLAAYADYLEAVPNRAASKDIEGYYQTQFIQPLQDQLASGDITQESFDRAMNGYDKGQDHIPGIMDRIERAKTAANHPALAGNVQAQDFLWKLAEMQVAHSRMATREGAVIGDLRTSLEGAVKLHPEDVTHWNGLSNAMTRDVEFFSPVDHIRDPEANTIANGFTDKNVQAIGDGLGRGVYVESSPLGGPVLSDGTTDAVRSAVRLRKPLVIDLRPLEERPGRTGLDGSGIVQELYADAYKAATPELEQANKRIGALEKVKPGSKLPLGDPELVARADALVAAAAQQRGYDSILRIEADGTMKASVFDPSNVRVVSDTASRVVAHDIRGYFAREFTDGVREALSGANLPEDARRVIYGSPKLIHDMHRISPDMTLNEAEAAVRTKLKNEYGLTYDGPIFERDPLKVHTKYIKRVTDATMHEVTGFNAGRLAYLGDVAPALMGGAPAGRTVYEWKTAALPEDVLDRLPGPLRKAMNRSQFWNRKLVETAARAAQADSYWAAEFRAALEGDRTFTMVGRKAAAASRRSVEAGRQLGASLGDDLRNAVEELQNVSRERAFVERIRNAIAATERGTPQVVKKAEDVVQPPAGVSLADFDHLSAAGSLWLSQDGKRMLTADDSRLLHGGRQVKASVDQLKQREKDIAQRITDLRRAIRSTNAEATVTGRTAQAAVRSGVADQSFADRLVELMSSRTNEAEAYAVKLERLQARMSEVLNEENRRIAAFKMDPAPVKAAMVPVRTASTGFVPLKVKGLEGWAMPAYIAQEFNTLVNDLPNLNSLHRLWRQFNQAWKEWATFRYPGFHIRNHMGAWFNNVLGGTTNTDYSFAVRIRKALLGKKYTDEVIDKSVFRKYHLGQEFRGREGDLTWGELAQHISHYGIGVSNSRAVADIRSTMEAIAHDAKVESKRNLIRRGIDKYDERIAMPLTDSTENFHRVAGFLAGLRQTGGDFHGGRMFVMMRQGDYMDLTDFEARVVKDVLPFYKWLRTNLPYQIRTLLETPGKTLAFMKARDAAFTMQGIDPEQARHGMPTWMRDEFALPIPKALQSALGKVPFLGNGLEGDFRNYMMLDLPMADLHIGAQEFVSSFLPFVRPFFESYITQKSLFTGAPLTGKLVPLPGFLNVPVVRDILTHLPGNPVKKAADGTLMMDDKLSNVLTVLPMYSRFRNWALADPSRANLRMNTLASTFFGLGIRPVDQQAMDSAELDFYFNELEPLMAQMKDLGVQLPSVKDLSPGVYSALGLQTPAESDAAYAQSQATSA